MRMVVMPKPPDAARHARARAQRASRKDRERTNPLTLAAADHLILITSLPADVFSTECLAALYRLRWQIELAFKRMKSSCTSTVCPQKARRSLRHGCMLICSSRSSSTPPRSKSEIFPPEPGLKGPPRSGASSSS